MIIYILNSFPQKYERIAEDMTYIESLLRRKNMKKFISLVVLLAIIAGMAISAVAYEPGEILDYEIVENGFTVVGPEDTIKPRIDLGEHLFTIFVERLGQSQMLTTINSPGKYILGSAKYKSIEYYSEFNVNTRIGVCYWDPIGNFVVVGNAFPRAGSELGYFKIVLEPNTTHYGFVVNGHAPATNCQGQVRFAGLK